jgi:hypothetical protein
MTPSQKPCKNRKKPSLNSNKTDKKLSKNPQKPLKNSPWMDGLFVVE